MIYYMIFAFLFTLALVEVVSPSANILSFRTANISLGNHRAITKKYNILATLIIVFLVLMAGFRWETGIDFGIYKNAYNNVRNGVDISRDTEYTFILISRLLPSLTVVLFFYVITSLFVQYKCLKEQSTSFFVSLFLLYSYLYLRFDMGIIRQGLAISFTIHSIKYIQKKNFIGFNICMIVAFLFHNTAIIFYPAYFLADLRYSKSTYMIVVLISFMLGLTNVWRYIAPLIARLPIPLIGKYMNYFTSGYIKKSPFSFSDINELVYFSFALYSLQDLNDDKGKRNRILLNIYFIGTSIMYLFKSVDFIYGRGVAYYLIVDILLLPEAIRQLGKRQYRVAALLLLSVVSFLRVYGLLTTYSEAVWPNYSYYPYTSVLWQ